MGKKPQKEKTIMLPIETYNKLCRLQTKLEKIYGKKIPFGKVIETLMAVEIDWSELA